jgi:phosphinothricin acetyltransferase
MSAIIRVAQSEDLAALTDLYNHFILNTPITFDLQPYTVEQRKIEWFDHYASTGRYRLLVAERDGIVVGYTTSSKFAVKAAYDTSVETSIYLHPTAQGQGIGTQLYTALFAALATEDVHRAYGGVTQPNPASTALHRRFGFRRAGLYREVGRKFDRYWDVEWLEKVL